MTRVIIISVLLLLIVVLEGCTFLSRQPTPPCDVHKIVKDFTEAYNEGQIRNSTDYFTDDFKWLSDTEIVNGERVDHFAGETHEELAVYFQNQYDTGQEIHVGKIDINGVDTWHGGVDIGYKGESETSDGMGVLTGKSVVDCQAEKITVWSMATHYPKVMSISDDHPCNADLAADSAADSAHLNIEECSTP